MVTPTYGTATFLGLRTKNNYSVDFYIADVVGTAVKFDSGSGAGTGSLPFWKAPEDAVLVDLSIASGPTVMTKLVPTANGGVIPGRRYRIANFLNSLNPRPNPNLGVKANANFGMIEE